MSELKPCPFCGGEASLLLNAKRKIYGKDEYRTGAVACCNVCEARMFYGSEKLAIEAWNRRAGDAHTIEPERKTGKMVKILADILDGSPLTQPCDRLCEPEGWCREHCKAGQTEPDAECWLKYAEVKADE